MYDMHRISKNHISIIKKRWNVDGSTKNIVTIDDDYISIYINEKEKLYFIHKFVYQSIEYNQACVTIYLIENKENINSYAFKLANSLTGGTLHKGTCENIGEELYILDII